MSQNLLVHLLNPNAHEPKKLPSNVLGYDLFALTATTLEPNTPTKVHTGIGIAAPIGWGAIVVDSPDTVRAGRFVFSSEVNVNGREEVIINMGVLIDPSRDPRDPFNAIRQRVLAGQKIGRLILILLPDFKIKVVENAVSNIIPFPEQKIA